MTTLAVLKFPDPDGAEQALQTLKSLQQKHLIKVVDSAVVAWRYGKKGPRTWQAVDTTSVGALGGAFWGMLFGSIFLAPFPLLGLAIGAAAGAIGGSLTDIGINDGFIAQIRDKVSPGTSTLFVLSEEIVAARVIPELRWLSPELVTTNLPAQQEAELRGLCQQWDQ